MKTSGIYEEVMIFSSDNTIANSLIIYNFLYSFLKDQSQEDCLLKEIKCLPGSKP